MNLREELASWIELSESRVRVSIGAVVVAAGIVVDDDDLILMMVMVIKSTATAILIS